MTPDDFLRAYGAALASQDWERVEPLMHPNVCVVFSDGTYRGLRDVKRVYTRNFLLIKDEKYEILNVHWLHSDPPYAVGLYEFRWSGAIEGRPASGGGRGTCVLTHESGKWLLLLEHLGPPAK